MRRVSDAMHAPPVVVHSSTTVQAASARMLDGHAHAAVVVDDDTVDGLVTAEQVAVALGEGYDAGDTLIGVIADRNPTLLDPDEALAEAHQIMRAAGRRFAVVVGPKRKPLGLLEDPEAAAGLDFAVPVV
jgi:CBS domain-containing protein